MGQSWNLEGGRKRRGVPSGRVWPAGPRRPAPLAPEHRPRGLGLRTEVPARGGFWFRHPAGPVGVPSVGCLCLASPRDQSGPAWSGGRLGAVREACCYLLKDTKNTREKTTRVWFQVLPGKRMHRTQTSKPPGRGRRAGAGGGSVSRAQGDARCVSGHSAPPPLLRWTLSCSSDQQPLAPALTAMAGAGK